MNHAQALADVLRRLTDRYTAPGVVSADACSLNGVGDYCLTHEVQFWPPQACPMADALAALRAYEQVA